MKRLGAIALIVAISTAVIGCRQFNDDDMKLLDRYGAAFVLGGEGPGWKMTPVSAVYVDNPDRSLSDEDFAKAFPAIKNMDPYTLLIRGPNTISDASIELLSQLQSLQYLDVSGTDMSYQGLCNLRVQHLQRMNVPTRITEAQAVALQKALSFKEVTRWEAPPRFIHLKPSTTQRNSN